MATITEPGVDRLEGERRFVIHDVGWEGYETLLTLIGDRPIRLTYDRGHVEFMSPLLVHERYRYLLGRVVDTVTEELVLPVIAGGATTFKREDVDRGLEPDQCYYLANAERIEAHRRVDLTVDPPPDLAIEVEITRSALDRLGIYARLGVPEVWRFDGETLTVLILGPDGTHAPRASSASFPFLPMDEVARFLNDGHRENTRWAMSFRAWVRQKVVPLARGEVDE